MLCTFSSALAQVSNTTAEDFEIGMRLVFQSCKSEGLNTYPDGKEVLWDYSGLEKIERDTTVEEMIAPSRNQYSGM